MSDASTVDPGALALLLPYNPFDPAFHADPYAVYQKLREEQGPVVRSAAGIPFVLGHREISEALVDPRWGHGAAEAVSDQFIPNPDGPPVRPLFFMDPPDHTRLRGLVVKGFTPRTLERLRPIAQELISEILSEALAESADGPVDFMSKIAFPFPALVLGRLMGVPAEYDEGFRQLSRASIRGLDPTFALTPEEAELRDAARNRFAGIIAELVAKRRVEPADDLLSSLAAAEQEGDRLTELELISTAMIVLAAGLGTTVNLLGNGLLALLNHPEQLEWLRSHPEELGGAIEELIRYDSPVQMITRTALEDVELGGVKIAAGEQAFFMIGAANRDPEAYDNPDQLDLSRKAKNLGFGHGIHMCVAAPVARMTAQAALAELLRHDLKLAADSDLQYQFALVIRSLAELPVTIGATA